MTKIQDDNIVPLYDYWIEHGGTENFLYLKMPYYPNGILSDQKKFDLMARIRITKEMIMALLKIHENGYAFNDLKPDNICFDSLLRLKIIDFGNVRELESIPPSDLEGVEDFQYVAEINAMLLKPDIWGLGVCLFQLWHGPFPSDEERRNRLMHFKSMKANDNTIPSDILIRMLLDEDLSDLLELAREMEAETPEGKDEIIRRTGNIYHEIGKKMDHVLIFGITIATLGMQYICNTMHTMRSVLRLPSESYISEWYIGRRGKRLRRSRRRWPRSDLWNEKKILDSLVVSVFSTLRDIFMRLKAYREIFQATLQMVSPLVY